MRPRDSIRRAGRIRAGTAALLVVGLVAAAHSAGAQPPAAPAAPPASRGADAAAREAARDTTRRAVLVGTVHDSTADAPLAGATLQLLPLAERGAPLVTASADSLGRFRVAGLRPGEWAVTFIHPALDAYDVRELPTVRVSLAPGDSLPLTLGIPGPRIMHPALCPDGAPSDSTGGVIGTVRSVDGSGLEGAIVALSWAELELRNGIRPVRRRVPVTTGPGGLFRFCGVPTDGALWLRAESGAAGDGALGSGEVEVRVEAGTLRHVELVAGTHTVSEPALDGGAEPDAERAALAAVPTADVSSAAVPLPPGAIADATGRAATRDAYVRAEPTLRGRARLTGAARDAQGQPLAGVRVLLLGAGREARTRADGTFALDAVPSGSWTAEARAIGYEPTRATVALRDGAASAVALAFGARVNALEPVLVVGRRSYTARLVADIEQRKRVTVGRWFMGDELAREGPLGLTSMIGRTTGVRLAPVGDGRRLILVRGRVGGADVCVAHVYLDGMPLRNPEEIEYLVRPDAILAVEVYDGGWVPPQWMYGVSGHPCGAVVIWTKR